MKNSIMEIKKWIPKEDVPKTCYLEGLRDDYDGFRLFLKGEDENGATLTISFENHLGYRNFNESERLKTLNNYPSLGEKWTFFIVEESEFTKWIVEESSEIVREQDVTHYLIATPEDIVEVLAKEAPIFSWE